MSTVRVGALPYGHHPASLPRHDFVVRFYRLDRPDTAWARVEVKASQPTRALVNAIKELSPESVALLDQVRYRIQIDLRG